jgi:hypothetical protein
MWFLSPFKLNLASNPTLTPNAFVLQFTPANHPHRLGKHRLNFHLLNRVGR